MSFLQLVLLLGAVCWNSIADAIECHQAIKLYALDPAARDDFGKAVAVHHKLAVVGADFKGTVQQGAVYIYEIESTRYASLHFHQKLVPTDLNESAHFGSQVKVFEISNGTETEQVIMVSAPGATVNGSVNAGAVYLYKKVLVPEEKWEQVKKLTSPVPFGNGNFGVAIAANSHIVAVGETIPGNVHIFDVQNDWKFVTTVSGPVVFDPTDQEGFGSSIALNDNIMIVGQGAQNCAFLFTRQGDNHSSWSLQVETIRPQNQSLLDMLNFGDSAAVGDVVIDSRNVTKTVATIGAYLEASSGKDSGALYSYDITTMGNYTATTTQLQRAVPGDNAKFNHFGEGMVITDRFMLASSHRRNLNINGAEISEVGVLYLYTPLLLSENNLQWEDVLRILPADPTPFQFFAKDISAYYEAETDEYVILAGSNQDSFMYDKAGSAYVFTCKLNGYSTTTSATTEVYTTTAVPVYHLQSDDQSGLSNSAIAAAVIIPLFVVIFTVIVAFVYLKRKRTSSKGIRLSEL